MSKVNIIVLVLFGLIFDTTIWAQQYGFTRYQKQFQREVLRAHNRYRSRHCVEPLELDDELSQRAQMLAERNAQSYSFSQNNNEGYGQNSYYKSNSLILDIVDGDEPVQSWYNAMRYYDFRRGTFSLQTGSFTQLVWASSKYLGVGIALTPDRRSAFVIALYDPTGNVHNAFERNVSPDKC